jgi:hypothetical protein
MLSYVYVICVQGVPEVECAYDPAGFQELVCHDADYAVVVAASHGCVWVRHDYAPCSPWWIRSGGVGVCFDKSIRMIYPTIKWCIIVD